MPSTVLELAGLGAAVAATFIGFGLVPALYVLAAVLLFIGYALRDAPAPRISVRARVARLRHHEKER